MAQQNNQEQKNDIADVWFVDNYILLKDYYDRTISRIAARCVRKGNIALEDYPFYGYILDVLEEISETGDYIIRHKDLYPYVEKKVAGGMNGFRKTLDEYKEELRRNSTPDMIKSDAREVEKMKKVLEVPDKADDPTAGAGMGMEQLMEKLLQQDTEAKAKVEAEFKEAKERANEEQGKK